MGRRQSGLVPSGRRGFEGQEDLMLTPAPFYAPYITCLPPPCPASPGSVLSSATKVVCAAQGQERDLY